MGSGWNSDAILNCELTEYSGEWTMASFAEDIYNPLISSLDSSDNKPHVFNYDWRIQIPENGLNIGEFIDSITSEDEKVNLVGHSMGGLVGRSYLEQKKEENRLDKFMTVGSPHKGSALAYSAWSAGEVWQDNFLAKIATSLYLKRCGGLLSSKRETLREKFPSAQNLLPTSNCLIDKKSGNMKDVNSMNAQNNWLISSPSNLFNFFGSTVATLSGWGFETLESIEVKNKKNKSGKLKNWMDGKPFEKLFSFEGDGTVLNSSSEIIDVENRYINRNHSELVSSTEGITQIFDFLELGSPSIVSTSTEPESALVVIGYPANFILSGKGGKIQKSKNNNATFINPEEGNYNVFVVPQSENSLLMVGKFFKNGNYNWKEYNLEKKFPQFIKINFSQ